MALTTVNPQLNENLFKDDRKDLPPPPNVATTPCDNPWPRPYYLENGLRRVAPYHYTYNTFCKQRWRGREILDIFASEFRDRTREYYQQAIEEGRIVLNGSPCHDVHTIVQNGAVISHTMHRHEPPVTAQPVGTIFEDDDMIVINKPAGVPVHPAGRYKYNSVIEIMRAERNYAFNPLPCNRLDRLTSGVMFIGKTPQKAEAISQKLRERTVRKEYVARVKGRFPDGEGWDGNPMRGGIVNCEEAILQISPILGLNRARASGKSAKTLFRRVAYYPSRAAANQADVEIAQENIIDPDTGNATALPAAPVPGTEDQGYSIVHCLPLTGRTHQIRVHLQFLGHPISNDPIYSNRKVFGADLGREDNTADRDAEIVEKLSKMGKTEVAEAYAYSRTDKVDSQSTSRHADQTSSAATATSIVDQTQQMTVSEFEAQQRSTPISNESTATASVPAITTGKVTNTYKPLPQSLHAGPLPASMLSQTTAPGSISKNNSDSTSDPLYDAYVTAHDEAVADYNKRKGEKLTGEVCTICQTPLYSDPGPQELGIYLHALAYADLGGEWSYRSPMPEWAKPPSSESKSKSQTETNEIANGPTEIEEWKYDDNDDNDDEVSKDDDDSIAKISKDQAERTKLLKFLGDEKQNELTRNEIGMRKNREL